MKRYFWLCVPLAIALLWIAGGWRPAAVFYDEFRAWLSGGALTVGAVQATKTAIDVELRGSGVLEPLELVDIAAPLAGTVGQVHVKTGDAVKVGQVVASIRAGAIIERLEKSEQALRLAEAALKKSAAAYGSAVERLEKTRELRARDLIARNDVTAAEADAAAASAARDLAQAQVARQEAELAQLRQFLALANLVAPIAGVVTQRWVEPGGQVQSSAPVLTIAAPGSFKIIIEIPAQYLPSIHQGLAAQVELKDLPGAALPGQVVTAYALAPSGQKAAAVEIRLANAEFDWAPGAQASVTLRLKDKRDALLVPKPALVERDGRTFLYAIVDGRARRRQVTTGASRDGLIEITSGVVEGEWIIVADPQTIEPGRRVRVLKDVKALR
jgi:RND family efflux transporter MFP subunit